VTGEKRLIEEYLPVRAIGRAAVTEKSGGRKAHISTLHTWWARRPLAAARAAVYATLVSAAGRAEDPKRLEEFMAGLCRWGSGDAFPAVAVAKARDEILKENGGVPPKILDCFAGGGAIPLEVARLGGEAHAIELNPVAYLILLCTLVYPQQFGPSLAHDIRKWGAWMVDEAKGELEDLYPRIRHEGSTKELTPVAYLWARTVPCPNPALGPHELHLVRQTWVVKKPGRGASARFIALKPMVDRKDLTVQYEVVKSTSPSGLGFDPEAGSKRGSASCRICGAAVTADQVKTLGKQGKIGKRLMAIVSVREGVQGKEYLGSKEGEQFVPDEGEVQRRLEKLVAEARLTIPETRIAAEDNQHFQAPMYGMATVGSLFTERQLLLLLTCCKLLRELHERMIADGLDPERARAIATFLAMAIDRVADYGSSLCRWLNAREITSNTFSRQALPMVWDFSEVNPLGGSSGDLSESIASVSNVALHCAYAGDSSVVTRRSATDPIDGGPFDAVVTDPPYYDNISYADLSDFFYAWLQRSIGDLYPEHLSAPTTPKKKEIVAVPYRSYGDEKAARDFYDSMMGKAFEQMYKVLKPGGLLVCVYAHKTYAGWAALIDALRGTGFVVVEAWPLETERPGRPVGQGTASLASSIFLVARRREDQRTGDWSSEVYPELQKIISERVRKLPEVGVTGDDLVIAAVGAGLRAYTQFGRVELPNGEELPPERYLDEVQREVIETILADVFGVAKSGIQAVDQTTQFYVMGRFEFGAAWVDFDRANTLGKGIGVEMTGPRSVLKGGRGLVEQDGSKVRLRDYLDRGESEKLGLPDENNGALPPLIDILHRVLWLAERQPTKVKDFLAQSQPNPGQLRLVAQALSGAGLSKKGAGTSSREQNAITNVLGSWKRLVDDNLFGRTT
jgi:putative DNA methylase